MIGWIILFFMVLISAGIYFYIAKILYNQKYLVVQLASLGGDKYGPVGFSVIRGRLLNNGKRAKLLKPYFNKKEFTPLGAESIYAGGWRIIGRLPTGEILPGRINVGKEGETATEFLTKLEIIPVRLKLEQELELLQDYKRLSKTDEEKRRATTVFLTLCILGVLFIGFCVWAGTKTVGSSLTVAETVSSTVSQPLKDLAESLKQLLPNIPSMPTGPPGPPG